MNTIKRTLQARHRGRRLTLFDRVRQFVAIVGLTGKMFGQPLTRHFNRHDDCRR